MFVSHHLSGLIGIPGRGGGGGAARDVHLAMAGIYLPVPKDALKTTVYPPAQTPGQWLVLGGG